MHNNTYWNVLPWYLKGKTQGSGKSVPELVDKVVQAKTVDKEQPYTRHNVKRTATSLSRGIFGMKMIITGIIMVYVHCMPAPYYQTRN